MISSGGGGGGGGGGLGSLWGRGRAVGRNGSGPFFDDHYYTSTFPSTISAADRLYYSTQNINARIFS